MSHLLRTAAVLALFASSSIASAENVDLASYASPAESFHYTSFEQIGNTLSAQEQEIGQLRAEVASLKQERTDGSAADGCCADKCLESLVYKATCGWYFYGEAVIVKPYSTVGSLGLAEFDLAATPRLTLGWVGDSGFGLRARYWQFDESASFNQNINNYNSGLISESLNMYSIDLEATDRIDLGKWVVTGFAGARYANSSDRISEINNDEVMYRFSGAGLTTGFDLLRPFAYHWSFYGNFRYSVLLGTLDLNESYINGLNYQLDSAFRTVAEVGAGVQYDCELSNGMNFYARCGFEAQHWGGLDLFEGGDGLTFAGLALGAGILF